MEEKLDERLTGGNNKRILVVDDDKAIRDIISDVLSFMGFTVAVARSGNEGLDLFLKEPFDLVFTDLRMPGMDGWDLAFHVKSRAPNTPVVLITGQQKEEVMEIDKRDRVDFVMFKPFKLKEMQKTVYRMLGAHPSEMRC
jgi:CheY-like chemotaxis protein